MGRREATVLEVLAQVAIHATKDPDGREFGRMLLSCVRSYTSGGSGTRPTTVREELEDLGGPAPDPAPEPFVSSGVHTQEPEGDAVEKSAMRQLLREVRELGSRGVNACLLRDAVSEFFAARAQYTALKAENEQLEERCATAEECLRMAQDENERLKYRLEEEVAEVKHLRGHLDDMTKRVLKDREGERVVKLTAQSGHLVVAREGLCEQGGMENRLAYVMDMSAGTYAIRRVESEKAEADVPKDPESVYDDPKYMMDVIRVQDMGLAGLLGVIRKALAGSAARRAGDNALDEVCNRMRKPAGELLRKIERALKDDEGDPPPPPGGPR